CTGAAAGRAAPVPPPSICWPAPLVGGPGRTGPHGDPLRGADARLARLEPGAVGAGPAGGRPRGCRHPYLGGPGGGRVGFAPGGPPGAPAPPRRLGADAAVQPPALPRDDRPVCAQRLESLRSHSGRFRALPPLACARAEEVASG